MKKILLVILAAALIGCAAQTRELREPSPSLIPLLPENATNIPSGVRLYAFDDHLRRMKAQGKDAPAPSDPSKPNLPTGRGAPQPLPAVQSARHQMEIDASRRLYDEGKYVEAAQAVEAALQDEPENEFLLECYARALYRIPDRPASYKIYQRLTSLIDSKAPCETAICMNKRFVDSYWKYGTLLMDVGDWEKAAFEISRALFISSTQSDAQPFLPQAYSYLTKAYFHLGRYDSANYYADVALRIDPNNGYVKYYLDQMKEKSP